MADEYKEYNELVKLSEHLAKLELELSQKLAQGNSDTKIEDRLKWSRDLMDVVSTQEKLESKRSNLLKKIRGEGAKKGQANEGPAKKGQAKKGQAKKPTSEKAADEPPSKG